MHKSITFYIINLMDETSVKYIFGQIDKIFLIKMPKNTKLNSKDKK